ncbi:hypothetical protein O181_037720 [Austropuccinia psidii MF-1]|uniref:Integrase catalytic domain-containing protein n=1 Tax=Austropuccinia psidii MF-1 TaxID=1389203 RepID=A0A9Q3DBI7_9BASI|nr:hypothetical protein [Austropuccinia psidii MF-1]
MLGTKLEFSTAYHPQTDGLSESMIQTIEDILRTFCAHGMEYKDHERYTHDWVTLLPAVQLAYNKTKDFDEMWKRACDTAAKCIAEAKDYNKQRWDKSHVEPDFKEGDQVLVSTLKFNNIKGLKKMIASFVGPLLSLVWQGGMKSRSNSQRSSPANTQCFQKNNPTPPEILEVEESPGPVKEIFRARKIRLNGRDHRQYLVRFNNQTADKDKWLAEDTIPDGNLHLRRFRAPSSTEQSNMSACDSKPEHKHDSQIQ